MTKTCATCNSSFEPKSNRQRYCSPLCKYGGPRLCEGCDVKFEPTGRGQRYHSTSCWYETGAKTADEHPCVLDGCGVLVRGKIRYCSPDHANVGRREANREERTCEREGCDRTFRVPPASRRRFC